MENVLKGLQPEEVFSRFEALCRIPHGSRDTKRISDYCVAFAKAHGLKYLQDESNNVVIWKNGTAGYEDHPPVILQGHLDMVCEKEPGCDIDFSTDGLRLKTDGTDVYAEGTTLGGDDGIAVAYALAILASDTLAHPPLEVVFTVDEEIGMLGATAADLSMLRGRVLLNIDSEDEGVLTVSCAGGATSTITLPVEKAPAAGTEYELTVEGLQGGHSGVEINKGRCNANKLMGELLKRISEDVPLRLAEIAGGQKDNAIPRACRAVLVTEDEAAFAAAFARAKAAVEETASALEPQLLISCRSVGAGTQALTQRDSQNAVELLCALPNGVQAMSSEIPGLVQTSLNLGILLMQQAEIKMTFSVRSSVNAEKEALIASLQATADKHGAAYSQMGDYPAWEYRKDSRLRPLMVAVFEECFGRKPVVEAIHAGLECGILAGKLPGLDAVSFGPDMQDIHTTRERLNIASVARTWKYLCAVLERL